VIGGSFGAGFVLAAHLVLRFDDMAQATLHLIQNLNPR
jgi:hypothetical protein